MAQDTFPGFGLGLDVFCCIPCYFPSRLADRPPALGSWGGVWIKLTTHTGARYRLAFVPALHFSVDIFSPYPLAGGIAMAVVDDLFLSLTARPSVLSFSFLAYFVGLLIYSCPSRLVLPFFLFFSAYFTGFVIYSCPSRLGLPLFLSFRRTLSAS